MQLDPTDTCVDVGGNVGYFSLLMGSAVPNGIVHVFEPIPVNAALIRASAALNSMPNVLVNECAVGSSTGTVTFSVSRDSAFSSMRATGRVKESMTLSVPMLTLDGYLADRKIRRIDVLKIDVEGAEGLVISGASTLLGNEETRPRLVLIELYDPNLAPFQTSAAELILQMRSFGYSPYVIKDTKGALEPYDSARHSRYYNILFTI
jgi:FkbM family methyltransferase